MTMFREKMLYLILPVYVGLRLFLPFKYYWIWGDEAKYLACAKSFPFNRMFNNAYYDFHPVFYPYMIRFFSLFFRDHIAAIAVSFFSSLVLFLCAYRLFVFLNLKRRALYLALAYMAFNNLLLYFSKIPFRYELFACLFLLTFYTYVRWLSLLKPKFLVLSALFGGLTFMTSDLMPLVLIPILIGAFFVYGYKRGQPLWAALKKLIPVLLIVLIYISCVLLPKFLIYSKNIYYAGGVEGRIERVNMFGLRELIHPVYFPNAYAVWGKMQLSTDLNPGRIKNKVFRIIELFKYDEAVYTWFIMFFIAMPILIMIHRIFSVRKIGVINEYKQDLFFCAAVLGIIYPVIYSGFLARNSIAAVPFLAYFFGKGVDRSLSWEKLRNLARAAWFKVFLAIVFLIMAGATFKKNRYFIFTMNRIEQCDKVASVIDTLPGDGVLAEGLIVDALVYNSKKRIVTLPRSPNPVAAKEQIDLSIKAFDLHYLVLSEFWKIELDILPYPAVEYIKNNPDKFKLIKRVYERYDNGIRSNAIRSDDTFYIYEIIRKDR